MREPPAKNSTEATDDQSDERRFEQVGGSIGQGIGNGKGAQITPVTS